MKAGIRKECTEKENPLSIVIEFYLTQEIYVG